MKFSKRSIRIVSYVVTAYIILAVSWWSILLHREHVSLFESYEYIRQDGRSKNEQIESVKSMDQATFDAFRSRRKLMIISETLFIGLGIIIGLAIIRSGYRSLVETEKLKRNFLLAISHELKSPIAAVKLAFESIMRFDKEKGTNYKMANHGLVESNRLHELVENVLLATKLESDYQPRIQEIDASVIIEQAIKRQSIKNLGIEVKFTKPNPPSVSKIDCEAFRIVVDNILDNAIKYTADLGAVEIILVNKIDTLQISIADNGPGIPLEERDKIFDRFYRIGDERTRKSKGSGLGLYLVHELIKRNKGNITISNNTPQGTIFKIEWPKMNAQ